MILNTKFSRARAWAAVLVLPALLGCSASLSEFARKVNERQAASVGAPVDAKKSSTNGRAPNEVIASVPTVRFPGMPESSVIIARPKDIIRQYLLREGKGLPPTDFLVPNVGAYPQQDIDPLRSYGNYYASERNAFKKEDLKKAFEAEAKSVLLSGAPSKFASFLVETYVGQYDARHKEFKICFDGICRDSDKARDFRFGFYTRDYALLIKALGPVFFRPDDYMAREFENEASKSGSRSIVTVLTVELLPTVFAYGVVEAKPYSLRVYKSDMYATGNALLPDESRYLLQVNLTAPTAPTAPKSQLPTSVQAALDEAKAACVDAGGKYTASPKLLTIADVTADGVSDYIFDLGELRCGAVGAPYSGSGGSALTVYAGARDGSAKEAFSQGVDGFRILESKSGRELSVIVGGELCGQRIPANMTRVEYKACWRPLAWDAASAKLKFAPLSRIKAVR